MKITFVLPYANLGGGTKSITRYAEGLIQRGHDVLVISEPYTPPSLRMRYRDTRDAILGRRKNPGHGPEPNHVDWAGLPHIVRKSNAPITDAEIPDADVVIATFFTTAEPVSRLSEGKGKRVYLMQDYGEAGIMPLELLIPTWNLPLHMITISNFLVDLVTRHVGRRQIDLVPCGVDLDDFHTNRRQKNQSPTVGFLYREDPVKGFDIVMKAFELARKDAPELRLVTFGPLTPKVLPLPDGMHFSHRPSESELKTIYSSCDAWLFASRNEGFGLPILEAMASRTPVLGTHAGAASDILECGGGMLLKDHTPEEMAQAIMQVASMTNGDWQRLSDEAYMTAQKFTWEVANELFEKSLLRLLSD